MSVEASLGIAPGTVALILQGESLRSVPLPFRPVPDRAGIGGNPRVPAGRRGVPHEANLLVLLHDGMHALCRSSQSSPSQ